jgi:hypothetical protein
MPCDHTHKHAADLAVSVMKDSRAIVVEIRINCADCGMPFRFKGVLGGFNTNFPTVSPAGERIRLPIEPMDIDGPLPQFLQQLVTTSPSIPPL